MSSLYIHARRVSYVIAIVGLVVATGCSSSKKKDGMSSVDADVNYSGDSDSGTAMGLVTINFPYDSYVLTSETKKKLNKNIEVLKTHPNVKIQVEGHCDERGGIQYNIALGEKRSGAVRDFIADKGVDASRVTTISFGKERPIDAGHSEAAWAKNRRANFVITSQ